MKGFPYEDNNFMLHSFLIDVLNVSLTMLNMFSNNFGWKFINEQVSTEVGFMFILFSNILLQSNFLYSGKFVKMLMAFQPVAMTTCWRASGCHGNKQRNQLFILQCQNKTWPGQKSYLNFCMCMVSFVVAGITYLCQCIWYVWHF